MLARGSGVTGTPMVGAGEMLGDPLLVTLPTMSKAPSEAVMLAEPLRKAAALRTLAWGMFPSGVNNRSRSGARQFRQNCSRPPRGSRRKQDLIYVMNLWRPPATRKDHHYCRDRLLPRRRN